MDSRTKAIYRASFAAFLLLAGLTASARGGSEPSDPELLSEGLHSLPAVAFDGVNYLAVWCEIASDSGADWSVRGTRVSPAGTVLDPAGITISPVGGRRPDIAFDGVNYLVVWRGPASYSRNQISGTRVTPAGTVLDPGGFVISRDSFDNTSPAVAAGDSGWFVVWRAQEPFGEEQAIMGARVSRSAALPDSQDIELPSEESRKLHPDVAFDGSNYLVVWANIEGDRNWYYSICGMRIGKSGQMVDTAPVSISLPAQNEKLSPAVGFDGTNYLVAWQDRPSGSCSDIRGAQVTTWGLVLDTLEFAISDDTGEQAGAEVAVSDSGYFVVWTDERHRSRPDVYGARVIGSGQVLDPGGIRISCGEFAAVAAWRPNGYFVAYSSTASEPDIAGRRVGLTGRVLDSIDLVLTPYLRDSAPAAEQSWPTAHLGISMRATSVTYALAEPGNVSLKLYDVTGKLVSTLAGGYQSAGAHTLQLQGTRLAKGIYLMKLKAEHIEATGKLIIE